MVPFLVYLFSGQWFKKTRSFLRRSQQVKKHDLLEALTRMSAGALATVIAVRYPEEFAVVSMVLGLMTVYLVIMIDYFIQHLRR